MGQLGADVTFFFLVVGLEAKRELDLGDAARAQARGDSGVRPRSRPSGQRSSSTWRSTAAAPARTAGAPAMCYGHGVRARGDRARRRREPASARRGCSRSSWSTTSSRSWRSRPPTRRTSRSPTRDRDRALRRPGRAPYAPIAWRGPAAAVAGARSGSRSTRRASMPGHHAACGRTRHERLSAERRDRPRARYGADPHLPRAADPRARSLSTARRVASAISATIALELRLHAVDELRDRAAFALRQRRHPLRRAAARRCVASPITLGDPVGTSSASRSASPRRGSVAPWLPGSRSR